MQFRLLALLSAIATTALGDKGMVVAWNNCPMPVYLTRVGPNQEPMQSCIQPGGSFSCDIMGMGNSWGFSKSENFYSPDVPKLIWGWSDDDDLFYYSVSTVDGNPCNKMMLKSSDSMCPELMSPTGMTCACPDWATYTLTLC